MKKVIIQGDDWGYSKESNEGIEHAYEYGVLTETAVLVNLLDVRKKEEYRERIEGLKNKSGINKPEMGIGIHLNVTFGKPLSPRWPQPIFTRPYKGTGQSEEWTGSAWQKYFSQFNSTQVEEEYRRQIEMGLSIFGDIDHLDSHHFSAAYEPLKGVYEKLAKEYNLAVRPRALLSETPVYGGDFVVDQNDIEKLKDAGIKVADKYCLKLFSREKNPEKSFLQEIENMGNTETIEVMFHPAKGQDTDSWRKKDLELLTSKVVLDYFNNKNIQLITYKEL